jgi:WD40 repeat protein
MRYTFVYARMSESSNNAFAGRYLAAVSFDSTCAVWARQELPTQWELVTTLEGHENEVQLELYVLPSIIAGAMDVVRPCVRNSHSTHDLEQVKGVAWGASGRLLATCGRDRTVWIW